MKLIWAVFSGRPCFDTYCKLQDYATGAGHWPEWRERALAAIRGRIAKGKEEARKTHYPALIPDHDHSTLVQIFLYEGDAEAAWKEATEGGCSSTLRLRLAAGREEEHPQDAVAVYVWQADELAFRSQYRESVDLLVKTAALMKRMGRSAGFVKLLQELLLKHKARRNFMKLIEQNQEALYLS